MFLFGRLVWPGNNMFFSLNSVLGFSLVGAAFSYLPWSVAYILINYYFGYRIYNLRRKEDCKRILKKAGNFCSHFTEDGRGYGLSFGAYFICNITIAASEYGDTYTGWIITSKKQYEALMDDPDETNEKYAECAPKKESYTILEKMGGSLNNIYYRKRKHYESFEPRTKQTIVIESILKHYTEKKATVAFIYGKPGSGKSMIGSLLAEKMNAFYCNSFKPWEPGDTLSSLYIDAETDTKKPLVIALDEIDEALELIGFKSPECKRFQISVKDKSTWNTFFDNIERLLYPNTIFLLTSNKGPKEINELMKCDSYLRQGRINIFYELVKDE